MFKILRSFPLLRPSCNQPLPLRHFLSPAIRRSIITQSGPVKVQHVRLQERVNKSRILQWVQLTAFAGLLYYQLDILAGDEEEAEKSPKGRANEKEKQAKKTPKAQDGEGDVASEEEVQDDEDTIFIPLGFAYELPKQYYKGSDPEWQSFIQLSRDKKLCDYLKNQLVGLVGQFLGSTPQFEKFLGKGNKPGKYWLDIDFPDGPPPEYERKGIEITEDHIAWTTQTVHPLHYQRLRKALWPKPIASSIWASYKTMASLQYARVKDYLNLRSDSETSNTHDTNAAEIDLSDIHKKMTPEKQESPPKADNEQPGPEEHATTGRTTSRPSAGKWSSDLVKALPLLNSTSGLDGDIASSVEAFRKTFAKQWQPAHTAPERGTVIFSGLVELLGPKGVITLDVRAAYHAAEGKWTQIGVAPRRMRPKQQPPKGGR
ncbi:MAG: hypothetical protein Q9218_006390 [Villophora microphyllina]